MLYLLLQKKKCKSCGELNHKAVLFCWLCGCSFGSRICAWGRKNPVYRTASTLVGAGPSYAPGGTSFGGYNRSLTSFSPCANNSSLEILPASKSARTER